jgi:hypothetical protein
VAIKHGLDTTLDHMRDVLQFAAACGYGAQAIEKAGADVSCNMFILLGEKPKTLTCNSMVW